MMSRQTGERGGIRLRLGAAVGLGLAVCWAQAGAVRAQVRPPAEKKGEAGENSGAGSERRTALELSYEHRDLEALPALEALAKADPKDREVLEHLAVSLVTKSATVAPDEGTALRRRARSILHELKKSGRLSDLGEVLADGIPEDGGMQNFSKQSEAQAAMMEGEAAFARRDFAAARDAYKKALRLDPGLYAAALFVGDTYFAEGRLAPARTWFARAVTIDPDQETAHRYLGDAFAKSGQIDEGDADITALRARPPWAWVDVPSRIRP